MSLKIQPLYIYGSENPKDRNKIHLCNDEGKTLCGRKQRWGEVTAEITSFENGEMFTKPFAGTTNSSEKTYVWDFNKCTACEKKYENL